jgi:hypothetical protein
LTDIGVACGVLGVGLIVGVGELEEVGDDVGSEGSGVFDGTMADGGIVSVADGV